MADMIALLLEDEVLIALDVEHHLAEAGFEVVHVTSCAEAERYLGDQNPDVAVIDLKLRDGVCHSVAHTLADRSIPFIVHSGNNEFDDNPEHQIFAKGSWVPKPSEMADLAATAMSLVQQRDLKRVLDSRRRERFRST
ncbi:MULTISPECIES: VpsR-related response regulator [unclassified Mesorhizobium]|uniref:VpsR-related response regulator n=1 Tax=unclassified Mesorhizobium TaxID=325217 RepID=UPI00112872E1|nr:MULTISPECIES: VpsR-related response regulator [unclassified Mesorhizobium]MBZ9739721.1 VpsR-related response regulator [Mesorhizobium sp. CO1-1-4]MBZ9805015.1 VpsR-related response regulator [Mesorhizobium sp. ES1-6]TPL88753.1 response regulator [Mesorhizobium sp. B2-3-12]